jgi:hypothetical protein
MYLDIEVFDFEQDSPNVLNLTHETKKIPRAELA